MPAVEKVELDRNDVAFATGNDGVVCLTNGLLKGARQDNENECEMIRGKREGDIRREGLNAKNTHPARDPRSRRRSLSRGGE